MRHVLHITYDMNIGGTEQVIKNLVLGLDSQQYRSSVLCIDGSVGPWGEELQESGVTHYCLSREPGFDLALIRNIRTIIKDGRYDIIHAHQYTPFTYGWFGSVLTGVPLIFTEHGRFYPDVSSFKRRCINPLLQLRTASITAISKATKQALIDYENMSEQKIQVIYNGISDNVCAIDLEFKQNLGLASGQIVFGTISRLDPIKNQRMMIQAFARAYRENDAVRLLIVGDGPMRDELETLVHELNLGSVVIFTGFKANPQQYLAVMDVFLLPSLSEGTSMTLLEAMSFSKPALATAVGGTPEIVVDGETGYLVPSNATEDLAEKMCILACSESLRVEMGVSARKAFEAQFTLKKMCEEYEALYDTL